MKTKEYLLVDIGNSTTVFARCDRDKLYGFKTILTKDMDAGRIDKELSSFDSVYVSSVVPSIDALLIKYPSVTHVDSLNIPKLTLNVSLPSQVGADRVVNALSAVSQYHRSCIIVDSGTATTICYVSSDYVYHGGIIFPGMGIASHSLAMHTGKIPFIQVQKQNHFLGKTTEHAVQSGLYFGYIHMINGFIAQFRSQYPDTLIIGAGSGLDILKDAIMLDVTNPHLTLQGLMYCIPFFGK